MESLHAIDRARARWVLFCVLVLLSLVQLAVAAAPALAGDDYYRRCQVVETAEDQLGKPYVWGADGPDSFDCSGLVKYCYEQIGIYLLHGATVQYNACWWKASSFSESDLFPGDLVFMGDSDFKSHVGIYVGDGYVIEAMGTDYGVVRTVFATRGWDYAGKILDGYVVPTPATIPWYDPIASGNFDGDTSAAGFGRCDVGLFIDGQNGGTTGRRINVLRSTGSSPMEMQVGWYQDAVDNWSTSKTMAGDFNGDGKCDYALFCKYKDGGGKGRRVLVFLSNGSTFTKQKWYEDSTDAFETTQVAAGDFNGKVAANGKLCDDIALFIKNRVNGSPGRRILVLTSTGSLEAGGFKKATWHDSSVANWDTTRFTVGDYNGDDKVDAGLFCKYQNGGEAGKRLAVLKSTGTAFTSSWIWNSAADNWETTKVVSGDFDGNQYCDVALVAKGMNGGGAGKRVTPLISDGSSFKWQLWWENATDNWETTKVTAGDYNGDGYCDVGLYLKYANGGTPGRRFVMLKSDMPTSKTFSYDLWYNSSVDNWDITK